LLCCLAATGAVSATQQQPPTFRAGTRVVPIYATVQGGDGRLLVNLRKEDFEVLDNGKPQIIASFSSQTEPILGVALWDVSGSLEPTAVLSRSAATALVKALWPGDRIRFGSFGQEVAFSPLMTGDKPTLERIVNEELWFGGSSRLWYALERSLNLVRVERGRRVVIVLTDGRSMADSRSQNDALMAVHRADTMVYALGLDETGLAGGIRAIAEESGGGHSILKGGPEYDSQLEAVMVELHHQYLLGFVTEAADRKLHSLVVRTTIPGAKVRARRGYVAELPEQQSR
jgi:Ca-activated chloride channel family protein